MKISILSSNLAQNCVGRAYILAKTLQKKHNVEIVGPVFGEKIWDPVKDDTTIVYRSVNFSKGFRQLLQLRDLYRKIDGDVIYAGKPLFTSFGIGLIKKFFTRKPLVLDIDDWEIGFKKDKYSNLKFTGKVRYFLNSIKKYYRKSSFWIMPLLEKFTGLADKITVSSSFLQKKFGGTLVWHGRDESILNPENYSKPLLRKKYKINSDSKVIMFLGTPRKHKGIKDLIEAISKIKDDKVLLIIVGVDKRKYCIDILKYAEKIISGRFISYGLQPFQNIPEFLSMADIIVIPQRKNYSTIGQIPAKIFDAMAMAKPIIATDVSDLPEILSNCGQIIDPGDPEKLKGAINYFLQNPEEAEKMGKKARKRFENEYSWAKIEKILIKAIDDVKSNN